MLLDVLMPSSVQDLSDVLNVFNTSTKKTVELCVKKSCDGFIPFLMKVVEIFERSGQDSRSLAVRNMYERTVDTAKRRIIGPAVTETLQKSDVPEKEDMSNEVIASYFAVLVGLHIRYASGSNTEVNEVFILPSYVPVT